MGARLDGGWGSGAGIGRAVLLVFAALALLPASAPAAIPLVPADWATGVSAGSARLHAEVNPGELATKYRFEYLTVAAYEANLNGGKDGFLGAAKAPSVDQGAGSGSTIVTPSQDIAGLKALTAYRYRAVAINADGTAFGPEHVFVTRPPGGPLKLLDGRGWEMVSPADKNGGEVRGLGAGAAGALIQAAPDGESIAFGSASSFGAGEGAPAISRYLGRRAPGAWTAENISVPQLSGGYGEGEAADPYKLFSTELASALVSNGQRCRGTAGACPVANPPLRGSGAPVGYRNYYLRTGAGYAALLTASDLGSAPGPEDFELTLAGATPDLGHVVLSSCSALTPNAVEMPGNGDECDPAATNLYLWSPASGPTLVNLLPAAATGTTGAALAAPAGAVSADGSRVYWTVGGDLYLREGVQTKQVDGAPEVGGGGSFETATADGSVAFFTKGGHLYRYQAAAGTSTDLTPGGGVEGVLGVSADGSRVYYLTAAGLFLRDGAVTTAVAAAADAVNYPPATGTAHVSADGTRLLFLAEASLTGYDNLDQATREPVSQVYLYDASAPSLVCVSCNPTGARPLGPSSVPGARSSGEGADAVPAYKPRALAAGGRRVFFDSADALVGQDTNGEPDVYEWEAQGLGTCQSPGGCLNLISSGKGGLGAAFADASGDGADAFFVTDDPLVAGDEGSVDLYDAREGGGFPVPPKPIPCEGDACQPLPSPPDDPAIGTTVPGGGNPPPSYSKAKAEKKKPKGKQQRKKRGAGKKGKRGPRRGGRR